MLHFQRFHSAAVVAIAWAAASSSHAQFTTVLNLPPDPAPASIGAGTQANLFSGGALPNNFIANVGSELNIAGGAVGTGLGIYGTANISGGTIGSGANLGGVANITGGYIGVDFDVGGVVNMSGGIIEGYSDIYSAARVTISGGAWGSPMVIRGGEVIVVGDDFRLDGQPVSGLPELGSELTLALPMGSVLSGTLADGTPTAYSSWLGDGETPVALTLRRAALPEPGPSLLASPGDPVPQGIRAGQTLRLATGGVMPSQFRVGHGAKLEVVGGVTGKDLLAIGGEVSVSGGTVAEGFTALDGATVNLSQGRIRRYVGVVGATVNVTGGTMDGNSLISPGGVLNVSGGTAGNEVRARGGEVNLSGGRIGEKFKASAGAVVNVTGGTLDSNAAIGNEYNSTDQGTTVFNLAGGSVNGGLVATSDAVVNMSSGFLGGLCTAGYGSVWNISGGYIYDQFTVGNGSDVRMTGGIIGNRLTVGGAGGPATISGGAIGDSLQTRDGASLTLVGSDFRADGVPIAGVGNLGDELAYNLPQGALLTGRFEDGTPFAFTTHEGDSFAHGTLKLRRGGALPVLPAFVHVTSNAAPWGVGDGQTLLVDQGGVVANHGNAGRGSTVRMVGGRIGENFEAVGATVEIAGGEVNRGFDAFGTHVTISGGRVERFFDARAGSRVDITGGSVGDDFTAYEGSVVNIRGGSVDRWFRAKSGSVVNISGGSIWASFQAEAGSTVNMSGGRTGIRFTAKSTSQVTISGGEIGSFFAAEAGSQVTLKGTEFFLDGAIIPGLAYDTALTITARNKTLTGLLADGSPLNLELTSDYFNTAAVIRVMRVFGTSDFDRDGDVDGADLVRWQAGFGMDGAASYANGDANGDSAVDGADFLAWQRQIRAASNAPPSTAVPEPSNKFGFVAAAFGLTAALATGQRQTGRCARRHKNGLTLRPIRENRIHSNRAKAKP